MYALLGLVAAVSLASSAGDPRTIDPAANRPEVVGPRGGVTAAKTPRTRAPKNGGGTKVPPPPPQTDRPKRGDRPSRTDPSSRTGRPSRTGRSRTDPPDPDTPRRRTRTTPIGGDPNADTTLGCFAAKDRCWRLNVTGISVGVAGLGMIGAGVTFVRSRTFPIPDDPVTNRSLRPPGAVLLALGSVSVVAGVLMIVVGHTAHRRANSHMARVRLTPGGLRW